MKSIVLPAGTEHVQFGELAHLIADALWPDAGPDDDSMTNAFARINLDTELARAVDSGALPVKDPLTLGPHTYPVGYALKTALVTVNDLQRFVSDRGLSVIVETPEPQAADAPATKVEARAVITVSGDDKPWLVANPKDPEPAFPWYTPARYFARQLVIDDSTLLVKKLKLAEKIADSLAGVGIFKRGKIKKPLSSGTVLKSFVNVALN